MSDLYYATFHAICEAMVSPLAGPSFGDEFKIAYTRVYRQLAHNVAEKRCKTAAQKGAFSDTIARFAKHFTAMKDKRNRADYHPLETFRVSVVRNDCSLNETRLKDFWSADGEDRTAFAFFSE